MHVGRGHRDVAQRGRAEPAHVLGPAGEFREALVEDRIGPGPVEIVEAGVVIGALGEAAAGGLAVVGEMEAAVAVVAFQPVVEEQRLAAPGRGGIASGAPPRSARS